MLVAAGEKFNLLARSRLITPTSSDALFPPSFLYDDSQAFPWKPSSNAANLRHDIDLAFWDGAMGSWSGGAPSGWTKTTSGGGTVAETTVAGEVRGGTGSAAKFNKSAGTALLYRDIEVRSGEPLVFQGYAFRQASGSTRAIVQDLRNGYYLTSGGAWQAAIAYVATSTDAAYTEKKVAFTTQTWATVNGPLTTLRLTLEENGAGGGADFSFWDDAVIYPQYNFLAGFGHNLAPVVVPTWKWSTDNFGAVTTFSTPTLGLYDFWSTFTARTERYLRLELVGTNPTRPQLTEIVIANAFTAGRGVNDGVRYSYLDPLDRQSSGDKTVRFAQRDRRRLVMEFENETETESRDEIFRRARGGGHPLVLVPLETESVCIHGRFDDDDLTHNRLIMNYLSYGFSVTESIPPAYVA